MSGWTHDKARTPAEVEESRKKDLEEYEAAKAARKAKDESAELDDTEQQEAELKAKEEADAKAKAEAEAKTKAEDEEEAARASKSKATQAAEQESQDDADSKGLSIEERMDAYEKELELRDVKYERLALQAQKFKTLADRRAGEIGHLRLTRGTAKVPSKDQAETDEELWDELEDTQPAGDKRRGSERVLSEFEMDAIEHAQAQATAEFLGSYKDIYVGDEGDQGLDPEFVKGLEEIKVTYQDEMLSGSPKRVRSATTSMLKEARLAYREKALEGERVEARKRRAVVSTKARDRRKATQATESKTSSNEPVTKKSIDDMTADEMAAAFSKDPKRKNLVF